MIMKEMVSIKLDREASAKICKQLLEPFDNAPIENILTIIDAFTMATLILSAHGKNEAESDEEDAIEKMVLDTLKRMSGEKTQLHFDKYIKL